MDFGPAVLDWNHPLFGCFDNFGICMITYCVPCYTVGVTAENLGHDCCGYGTLYAFFPWCIGTQLRGEIRETKGIPGSCFEDCLVHSFCALCAIVQDHREIAAVPVAQGESIARV